MDNKIKVLQLIGLKSLRAFNVFHLLLLGLKMTPIHLAKKYEKFFEEFENKSIDEKEKDLRNAVLFTQLNADEVEAVLSFAVDANNIPYSANNIATLNPAQIAEIILAVCLEIAKIKVFMGNEELKKN
ncbi:MAG: hypothetical protein LBF97_04625 [Elusimicrobiota bacterium]|jgi:hypothetical protein|nr:hypothetical protein [Elusimicrobiota bacterium]